MASLSQLNLTTPAEFINYYYEQLKQELGVFDLQISKVGFIGFLLNILGNTHFDLKQYYDSLFQESFVATSQTEEAQFIHAAIYGYLPYFATASTATGTIEFDMVNFLPRRQSNVVRREVFLGYASDGSGNYTKYGSTFTIDGHQLIIDSTYKFVEIEENGSYYYYVDIVTDDGTKINIPSSSSIISAPLYSTTQYIKKELDFTIKKYDFGSYQTFYFNIDSGQYLSDLEVYIGGEEYSVKYVKYLEKAGAKSVFLRKITNNNYVLEFGSGVRGNWVSGKNCQLVIKSCEGSAGNLIDSTSLKRSVKIPSTLLCYDYEYDSGDNLVPISPTTVALQNPLVNFYYSEGGEDPLSGEDLRDSIISFIQTRDNLVSQPDFYNIANKYLNDFKFLFKKYNVFDNIFHLCRSFRDRNQEILYSTNHTIQVMNTNVAAPTPALSEVLSSGTLGDGTYGYIIAALDAWGRTLLSTEATITISATGGTSAIQLDWTDVTLATSYIIYGRVSGAENMYWTTTSPTYTDDGTEGTACTLPTTFELQDLMYQPTFTLDSLSFISPFLYKGNSRMGYYDGYLIKDLSRVPFAEVTPNANTFGTGFEIPSLYLNLVYDDTSRETQIQLKSYQDITALAFNISIYGENIDIVDQRMEPLTGSFVYDYANEDTVGVLDGAIQIEVIGAISDSTLSTNYESYDIDGSNDVLTLKFNSETSFTVITLTHGTRTAAQIAADINTTYGSTVASSFSGRVRITPPGTFPPGISQVYQLYVGASGNTAATTLGFVTSDTTPITLNGPFTVEKFRSKTSQFYQMIDISDQLRLIRYFRNGSLYITGIPIVLASTFNSDTEYYLDKMKNFIVDMTFSENRMISDNVQCRFLNSYKLESPYIESAFTQGKRIYSDTSYTYLADVLSTLNTPPSPVVEGGRYRVGTSPTGDFVGYDNQIASYTSSVWSFYSPNANDFVYDTSVGILYRWTGSEWTSIFPIQMPLVLSVQIKADKNYVEKNGVSLSDEREKLQAMLSDLLQKSFTGATISFYNSQIVEFIHSQMPSAKSVQVNVVDSSTSPVALDNGIEVKLDDNEILSGLKEKLDIVKYVPFIIYWDVNNISITIIVE